MWDVGKKKIKRIRIKGRNTPWGNNNNNNFERLKQLTHFGAPPRASIHVPHDELAIPGARKDLIGECWKEELVQVLAPRRKGGIHDERGTTTNLLEPTQHGSTRYPP